MLTQEQKITYIKTYIFMMKGFSPVVIPPRNEHEHFLLEDLYNRAKHNVKAMGKEIRV